MLGGTINIILICGGRLDGNLAGKAEGNVKALLKFDKSSLLFIAIDAINEFIQKYNLISIDEIAVVGGTEVQRALQQNTTGLSLKFVNESISGIDNIYEAIKSFSRPNPVLVISPDLPFLSAKGISEFVSQLEADDEIVVATITKEDFLAEYTGAKNRFEKIQKEYLTLASVFFFRTNAFITNVPYFRDIFKLRKNPFKLAMLLGFDLIFRLLFKLASIKELEQRSSHLCGCKVRAIRCRLPELAYDIDNLENYQFALQHLHRSSKHE